jgi:2-polyprenyl-3-methyl-5-hydroxy-6-metoxy-1,4-benzoquinol methylase
MNTEIAEQYGSMDWFINQYARVADDPWYMSSRSSQKVRYQRALGLLETIDGWPSSILDIGCATGDFTHLLSKKYGQKSSVTGIDFIETAINRARKKFSNINFRVASIFDVGQDYEHQVDLVTCMGMLCYLDREERSQALKSVKESLRPGGYALFSEVISQPPHFHLKELDELVAAEFNLLESETIHLKLLIRGENYIRQTVRRTRIGLLQNINLTKNILKLIPFQSADFVEKCSRHVGSFLASHTVVLCRR